MRSLDYKTLEALAELICGDNGPWYRKGWEIPIFFRNAGLSCPEHDGSTRKWWTLARLQEYNQDPSNIAKIIKRLADPREYQGNAEVVNEVIRHLNKLLAVEGLKVKLKGIQPVIEEITPTVVNKDIETREAFPKPDFAKIIEEPILMKIIEQRWEEVIKCIDGEAYLAAIIMMGSILEGVLLAIIHRFPEKANRSPAAPKNRDGKVKRFWEWNLSEMIDVAHQVGWLQGDVKKFAHILRDYRNLVHPWHQMNTKEQPDEDTCKIAWQVVQAAINDLIRLVK
ncbi:hypothetical protein [Thermosulfurimonas dismutans]|uniref:DUF4145 domain-containing protein n=1 Tax=Thermosulfurimonas dismutans TaxID=999894 RepID=A0A179D658_9BACT|nr:hypothetical protein [Thermosulfurimonas dismutans]OAQ21537.1 hypothetical protein TDIS_0055 [Thermosulfurimonas dismutans]